MSFFDSHTHAHFSAYRDDFREVIRRALDAGVWLNNVGTQRDTSRRAVEVAREYEEGVYASVGLHPIHTSGSFHDAEEIGATDGSTGFKSRSEEFDEAYYEELAKDPKVVAIGECGLDYYHIDRTQPEIIDRQKKAFIAQIKLANKIGKPLMIHCRDDRKSGTGPAYDDLLAILEREAPFAAPPIAHSFARDLELAKKLLDLGAYFTFNGIITFTHDYDEVLKYLPADRILSETDAPYLTPVPHRGERNEPAYVVEVVRKIAEVRGASLEEIAETVRINARNIFEV